MYEKILIIDDHPIARLGLIANIQKDLHPVEIAECGGDNALLSLSKHNFDLIIREGKIAGVFSFGLIQIILQKHPGTKILIFAGCDENVYSVSFLATGAIGYVSKSAPIETLQTAIENIPEGNILQAGSLTYDINKRPQYNTKIQMKRLSGRETEIASLLLKGQNITFISKAKNLKVSTVSTHKARIFSKLGIINLLQLKDALYLASYNNAFSSTGII